MIKPRPWWLFFIGSDFWVTIAPHIYHPRRTNPSLWPATVIHEETHIRQQEAMGLWKWLCKYSTSRTFRFSQEVEACRNELASMPTWARYDNAVRCARDLSTGYIGLDFRTAASSFAQAFDAITEGLL